MPISHIAALYQIYLSSTGICTDTRKVEYDCLFFALRGPNFNGNLFAAEALQKGAKHVVIEEEAALPPGSYTRVSDTLSCLQQLAHFHRRQLKIPFIAITGSNGKTTTKELAQAVLKTKYHTFATKGNLNNHIGVPLSLLSVTDKTEIAVIEMGANHEKELKELCRICEPTHGLVTNIGLDHLEGYGSLEGVLRGNSELYEYLSVSRGKAFVNSRDTQLMSASLPVSNRILYGCEGDIYWTESLPVSGYFEFQSPSGRICHSQLIGTYNQDNINAAIAMGIHFGVDEPLAIEAIEKYQPSNNRSQLFNTGKNTVILDAYNANPSSMQKAIESFASMDLPSKMVVLGDMYELGDFSESEHSKMIAMVEQSDFQKAVFCGEAFYQHKKDNNRLEFYESRFDLENAWKKNPPVHSSILLKGSRGIAMEKLLELL